MRFIGTISVDRWRNNYDGVLEEVRRGLEYGTIKGEWTEKGEIRARQKSWQWAKHSMLYPDSLQALKRRTLFCQPWDPNRREP